MIDENEASFPHLYIPEFASTLSIYQRAKDVTVGMHQDIVFLVATPSGVVINDKYSDVCQIPKENGWLGRYLIGAPTKDKNNRPVGRYLCSYWVNMSNIEISTVNIDGKITYQFISVQRNDLPAKLTETLDSSDFFEKYLEG